jgi:predicted AAA+ superfamily ATPase
MILDPNEVIAVLRQMNPWWQGQPVSSNYQWRRAAYQEIESWLIHPPTRRAVLVSGARQIGKTTLLLQVIESLLAQGVTPSNIFYASFDHPMLKLTGLEKLVKLWQEAETIQEGTEYLLLDEIQYTKDWQVWLKHQVDFSPNRRIAVTGSATPLNRENLESGVGRWHAVQLATLSFYEFLKISGKDSLNLPTVKSLQALFDWPENQFGAIASRAQPLTALFHRYLLQGGFPETATVANLGTAQKLLREDIVDKVLKRDMTALYGVRNILELEQVFLYLCMTEGGILDVTQLSQRLELPKQTVNNFIDLLESTHLIYKLKPYGYGKEVIRGKSKVYLAHPSISHAVLMKGKAIDTDESLLGNSVETAFFRHVFARYYQRSIGFSYWRAKKPKELEVDIIAEVDGRTIPFEVKYRSNHTGRKDLKGICEFCKEKNVERGYVITKEISDFGILAFDSVRLLKIPAPLACYWLGKSEMIE